MLPVLASSKFFSFRAELNGKYLQSVYGKQVAGSCIEASAGTVAGNARTRFLVERSKKEGLIHVRCCYNNKYWVPVRVQDSSSSRWITGTADDSGSSRWIIGTANEPEEDLSSPSCTLFQALPVKDKSIRFLHSGLQKFACVVSIGDKIYLQLGDGDNQENKSHNFTVGFLPPKELPKHVAFKGNNGKYLSTKPLDTLDNIGLIALQLVVPVFLPTTVMVMYQKYLRFQMKDIKDARAIFTTFTNDDGTVRIKANTGGFWRRDRGPNDLIWTPFVEQDDNDADSLFEVVRRDDFIALRNLGNNKFCTRIGGVSVLGACADSIPEGELKLEVPVKSREISDVEFHLDEARIYKKENLKAVTITRHNDTDREVKATFSFTKKREMVTTWAASASFKIGVKAKFKFGTAPILAGGQVTTSTEASAAWTTSERNADETTITEEYHIPARSKVAGIFVAMRASCDVPYSYKQTDVLTTGEVLITDHNDGIYTVTNNYNFRIKVTDNEDEIRKLEGQYC